MAKSKEEGISYVKPAKPESTLPPRYTEETPPVHSSARALLSPLRSITIVVKQKWKMKKGGKRTIQTQDQNTWNWNWKKHRDRE